MRTSGSIQKSKTPKQARQPQPARIFLVCLLAFSLSCIGLLAACAGAGGGDNVTVSVRICCIEAVEAGNATATQIGGTDGIVYEGTVVLENGATVMDTLAASGVAFDSQDSSFGAYVTGIGGLASGEVGEMSGWLFSVNGKDAEVSADALVLSDGDKVEWNYILEPVW